METKKINFKQKKYILPLVLLPFLLLFVYVGAEFTQDQQVEEEPKKELSIGLGETKDTILSKDDAYNAFFQKDDTRTMLDGLDSEEDSLLGYNDLLSDAQKRRIDSARIVASRNNEYQQKKQSSYYNPKEESDYKRSSEIIRMLNEESYSNTNDYSTSKIEKKKENTENDPVKILKEQMLVMDSIEKARDPEYQKELLAEKRLKANQKKMEEFMNSTFDVSKVGRSNNFNSIHKEEQNYFIKAVIDEDNKGYLGSRIRLRLLEDIFVGKKKIKKGEIIYGQISGFQMQRVNLSVISVLANGEILPINLSVYDVDGMKGLYVPQSVFRDMVKELGSQSVQGTQMDMGAAGFFTSIGSRLFTSTSKSIANLIKINKAKLKYNSYIYLINEKELKESTNN